MVIALLLLLLHVVLIELAFILGGVPSVTVAH